MKRFLSTLLCLMLCALTLAPAFAYETLEYGDAGDDVYQMQAALAARGYSVTADGKFGQITRAAVCAFQKDQRLMTDGKVVNQTLTALYSASAAKETDTASDNNSTASSPAASATQTPAPAASGTVATVKGGALRLRPAPNTKQPEILFIPDQSALLVVSEGSEWSKVDYEGRSGYVMTKYLSVGASATVSAAPTETSTASPDAAPTAAPTAAPATDGQAAYVKGGALRLRPAPSTKQPEILYIPDKAAVMVMSKGDTWSSVVYQGKSGYAMTKYLDFSVSAFYASAAIAGVIPVIAAENGATLGTATITADARFYQTLRSLTYGILSAGTTVDILATGNDHCTVSYDGKVGYIETDKLTFGDAVNEVVSSTPFVQAATGSTATVAVYSGLRATPSKESPYICPLDKGMTVKVISHGAAWTYAEYKGQSGYVMTQVLTFGDTASPFTDPRVKYDSVTVGNGDATAYEKIGGAVVGTIPEGTTVTKIEVGTKWSMVVWNTQTVYVDSSHFDAQYAVYTYAYFEGEIAEGGATLYSNWRAGVQANNTCGTVPGGTQVHVQGAYTSPDGTKFYDIKYPKFSMLVLADRVIVKSEEIVKTQSTRVKTDSWVTAGVKNDTTVYEKADADSAALGVIPAGAFGISAMGVGSEWTQVLYENLSGYVRTASLTYSETLVVFSSGSQYADQLSDDSSL